VLVPCFHVREELQLPVLREGGNVEDGEASRCRQVEVVGRAEVVSVERQRLQLYFVEATRDGLRCAGDGEVNVRSVRAEKGDRLERVRSGVAWRRGRRGSDDADGGDHRCNGVEPGHGSSLGRHAVDRLYVWAALLSRQPLTRC